MGRDHGDSRAVHGRESERVRTLRAWIVRLVGLPRRGSRERDIAAELESHLDMHVEHNIRAGMSPVDARRQALIALGGVEQTKEQYRDRLGIPLVETISRDILDAGRRLRRSPGAVLAILLTLAAALGVNGTMFALGDALVLRPFSLPQVDELVAVNETRPDGGLSWTSAAAFRDWKQQATSFEALAALMIEDVEIGEDGDPERLRATWVSHEFFSIVGRPALGRGFLEDETSVTLDRRIILADGLWRRRFGADPTIVGRSVVIDGIPHEVVGVAPPDLDFPYGTEVWLPIAFNATALATRDARVLLSVGCLTRDATLESARAEMSVIATRMAREFPDSHAGRGALVRTLGDAFVEEGTAPLSALLQASALLVLLVACANITNLVMALAGARRREVAVRSALGATRSGLLRGLWIEHGLLALLAPGARWRGRDAATGESRDAGSCRTVRGWVAGN